MTKLLAHKRDQISRLVLRMLLERELSGYDIWKELSMKGVKVRTNYLYMILSDMLEKDKLLKARWIESHAGPRRHLYSLNASGRSEFMSQLRDSVNLIQAAFTHSNLNARDLPDHVQSLKRLFSSFQIPLPGAGSRFVLTTPSFDPLICFPISYYVISEAFPSASVSVVKPPGTNFFSETPANLTFIDGRRHDMPLKDNFADYLMLEGFPTEVSEEETLSECFRVLRRRGGHLIARVPNVLTEEKRPKFTNLAEFSSKLFYDFSGQDRLVSVERLKRLLARQAITVSVEEARGNVIFHAQAGTEKDILQAPQLTEIL